MNSRSNLLLIKTRDGNLSCVKTMDKKYKDFYAALRDLKREGFEVNLVHTNPNDIRLYFGSRAMFTHWNDPKKVAYIWGEHVPGGVVFYTEKRIRS